MNRPQVIAFILELPEHTTLAGILARLQRLLEEPEEDLRIPTAVPTLEDTLLWLRTPTDPQDALMLRTFYATGIRGAELRALVVADLVGDWLFVRSGKYDADRYVLLDPTTAQLLRDFTRGKALDEPIFKTSNSAMQRHIAKWAEACGLRQKYAALGARLCAHSLRHGFATHCWLNGMDFLVEQRLLGHQLGGTTDYYIKTTTAECAARYHRVLGRKPPSAPAAHGPWAAPERAEVIERILAETPETADLETILEFLARWLLSLTRGHHREFMQQLEGEVPATELLGGRRLPLIVTPTEIAALFQAGGLLLEFLYRSMLLPEELPKVRGVNSETGIVDLGNRQAVVDFETARKIAEFGLPRLLESTDPLRSVLEAAERTGLAARFRAVGRTFTPATLRHSGATHLLESGLDIVALHELLGNHAFVTTEYYHLTAAELWRPEYLRTHPLALLG